MRVNAPARCTGKTSGWRWDCPTGRVFAILWEASRLARARELPEPTISQTRYRMVNTHGVRRREYYTRTRPDFGRIPIWAFIEERLNKGRIPFKVKVLRLRSGRVRRIVYRVGLKKIGFIVYVDGHLTLPRAYFLALQAPYLGEQAYERRLKREAAARRKAQRDQDANGAHSGVPVSRRQRGGADKSQARARDLRY